MIFILFLVEIFLLSIFSKALTKRLSQIFYKLTKSMKTTVSILAFIFLPGTFIHEISHMIMALIMFTKVGSLELMPKMEGDGVKLGSVQIEKVDFLRSLIIGAAPLIFGLGLIFGILFLALSRYFNLWIYVLLGFMMFEIGNTMFSSKKDMEGGIWVLAILGAIFLIGYLLDVKISWESMPGGIINFFGTLDKFFLIPLGIDFGLVIILRVLV